MPKQPKPSKGRNRVTWVKPFLAALAHSPNVTNAARKADISPASVWARRKNDPDFAAEWDIALEKGISRLEDIAEKRAFEGYERGVWHQGERVGSELHHSDTLAIFLLKAHRPERYRERWHLEHSGKTEQKTVVEYRLPGNDRDPKDPPKDE